MLEPFLKPLEISCRKMRKAENQQAQKGTGRNPANSSFRRRVSFLLGCRLSLGVSPEKVAANASVLSYFTAACPVLCSGNGQYSKGRCLCFSGWKGTECDVPTTQCIDPQCGGRGICIMGSCACNSGYKGENCEEGKRAKICRSPCLASEGDDLCSLRSGWCMCSRASSWKQLGSP